MTPDPTAKTVAFEDTAALVGIVLAAMGITLHAITDQAFWDGAASIAIGLLLVVVAWALGQQNMRALIGQALPEATQDGSAARHRRVTRHRRGGRAARPCGSSPEEVLVAARVDLDDTATVDELERAADEVERRLMAQHPEVRHVFLDPTDEPDEPSPRRQASRPSEPRATRPRRPGAATPRAARRRRARRGRASGRAGGRAARAGRRPRPRR